MAELIQKSLECPVCMDQLIDARQTPCGHSFCSNCREEFLHFRSDGSATLKCPYKCNESAYIGKCSTINNTLKKNFKIDGLLDIVKDIKSDGVTCSEEEECHKSVSRYCKECGRRMCDSCFDEHQCEEMCDSGNSTFSREEIEGCIKIGFDEFSDGFVPICEEHNTFARYVCIKCNERFICVYCKNRIHRLHKTEQLQNHVDELKENCLQSKYTRKHNNVKRNDIVSVSTELDNFREELCNELHVRKMINVQKHIKQQNEEEKKILEKYDDEVAKYISLRKKYIDSVNEMVTLLAKKPDFSFIHESSVILKKLQELSTNLYFNASLSNSYSINDLGRMKYTNDPLMYYFATKHRSYVNTSIILPYYERKMSTELSIELKKNVTDLVDGELSKKRGSKKIQVVFGEELIQSIKRIRSYSQKDKQILLKTNNTEELKLLTFSQLVLQKGVPLKLFHDAASFGNPNILDIILQTDNNIIDHCNVANRTALMMASTAGYSDCVKLLLQHNCDFDMTDEYDQTALMLASAYSHENCVALLLEYGCSVDMKDIYGKTALMMASMNGNSDCVALLLKYGAGVDLKDKKGNTALTYATKNGCRKCVQKLTVENSLF